MKFYALVFSLLLSSSISLSDAVRSERSLVAPGVGAERIRLGKSAEDEIRIFCVRADKTVHLRETGDLFSEVFGIASTIKIKYTDLYYFEIGQVCVIVMDGKVVAVAGFSDQRITSEGLDLARGKNYLLGHCGKDGLVVEKDGNHHFYIYPSKGFAIADDNNDDIIDLYLVFLPLRN